MAGMMSDTIVGIGRGSAVLEKVSNAGGRRARLLSIPATNVLYDTEKKKDCLVSLTLTRRGWELDKKKMLLRDCVIQGRVLDLNLY